MDGTHFKLAASRSDALSGATINFGALPSLQSSTGEVSRFAQIQESTNQIVFDYDPGLVVGHVVTFNDVNDYYIGGLSMKVGTTYTVSSVAQSASGNQWLVGLNDATGNPVTLNLDPILIDGTDTSYAFHLDGSAIVFDQAQPRLITGTPTIYVKALGLDIPTLTPDQTYFLVKDPTDTTNTVFRRHRRLGAGAFPKDDFALARFDGTTLYEHADPRRGSSPTGHAGSSTSAATRCATSSSPTRSSGSRSSTSMGCGSMPSPRCSTSTTREGRRVAAQRVRRPREP